MKRIQIIIGVLLLVTGIACTEDKGNYDYTPLNKLVVNGIKETYVVEVDSMLSIPVDISGSEGFREDDYDYVWYAWRTSVEKVPDTLSVKKDLNVKLLLDVGEYILRYVITEKASGVFFESKINLNVINKYSKGVMALSRIEGDDSDVTFINIKNTVTQHAYKQANGKSPGRHPRGIFYIGGEEGVKNVVLISTEERAITVEPNDFTDFMPLSDWFYVKPEGTIVEAFVTNERKSYEYLIIDGKAYNRNVFWSDTPFEKFDPKNKGDYNLAPFSLYGKGGFFYDRDKRCFIFDLWGNMIAPEALGSAFNANDMQMDMLYGNAFSEKLRAVMEDDNGKRYMISGKEVYDYDRETYEDIIQIVAEKKIEMNYTGATKATCFAISSKEPDFLYYAYGNKIKCVSMITGNELSEYTMEQPVDYMEFDKSENPDRLYVAVSDGSGTAGSGSIYYLQMNPLGGGALLPVESCEFKNVCGKVVDFECKK